MTISNKETAFCTESEYCLSRVQYLFESVGQVRVTVILGYESCPVTVTVLRDYGKYGYAVMSLILDRGSLN